MNVTLWAVIFISDKADEIANSVLLSLVSREFHFVHAFWSVIRLVTDAVG